MKQSVTEFLNSIIHLPYKEQTDAIGLLLIGQEEALSLAVANLAHADEKIAELQGFIKKQSAEVEQACDELAKISCSGGTLPDKARAAVGLVQRYQGEREVAFQARDIAEAKGRWIEAVQPCATVRELAAALPPDVLMHPMPFPDRLDYCAKMIQERVSNFLKEKFEVVARDAVDLTPTNQWLSVGQLRQWLRTVLNP